MTEYLVRVADDADEAIMYYGPFPTEAEAWADVHAHDEFFGDLETDLSNEYYARHPDADFIVTAETTVVEMTGEEGYINSPRDTYSDLGF
jgi:hypothetical protein